MPAGPVMSHSQSRLAWYLLGYCGLVKVFSIAEAVKGEPHITKTKLLQEIPLEIGFVDEIENYLR